MYKFTKLDLADEYMQIELDKNSKQLVVLNTHQGLYCYKQMPFGLSCAPPIFQKIIEQTLAGIPYVTRYLGDIVIMGRIAKDHITNLQKTLERLKDNGLCLHKSKCSFLHTTVTYLSHIIGKEGIRSQANKVEAI